MAEDPLYAISGLVIDAEQAGERRRLVDGVDLAVRRGEIYGLVGESGSGKSLSMMAGVGLAGSGLRIAGGTVAFDGSSAGAADQARLRGSLAHGISLLFQNAKGALNPFIRIDRQIERVLRLQDVTPARRRSRTAELLAAVGLDPDEIRPKYAHQLSGGQAQRVAMACALATEPRLLIADEPTTALDVTTEREILRFLTRLCRERAMAIVLVSHNLALVSEYCSRISILHAGHIVESGTVAEVYAAPLHPYTRGLLAAIPDVDRPRELVPLAGNVWGAGFATGCCRFAHRCSQVAPRCLAATPPLVHRNGHAVRCVLHEERAA
jgi:oligopeptide/dipeptide ABC transporter ATP-binding protein